MRGRVLIGATCGCVLLLAWAVPVWADTPESLEGAAAIADLNAQREVNGIPPVTTVDQNFASAWCPNEDTGPSGGEAARVLSGSTSWSTESSPWEASPIHQFLMYDPAFTIAGDVNVEGVACMGLGGEAPQPSTPTFYAFVGDRGPGDTPKQETVYGEIPFAPQQVVGLPLGQPTGPDLLAYVRGSGAWSTNVPHAVAWSLDESQGHPLPGTQFVDEESAAAAGYSGFPLWGGVMIPLPLAPGTRYTATITWEAGDTGIFATQDFAFTTGTALEPTVYLGGVKLAGTTVTLEGWVTPNGAPISDCRFEYGTTTMYGASAPCAQPILGEGQTLVSAVIGLQPRTHYYWRLLATNIEGTAGTNSYGQFTTGEALSAGVLGEVGQDNQHQLSPTITRLRITPRRFAPLKHGGTISNNRGAQVTYADSQAAISTFTVRQALNGVRQGGRCVPPPPRVRRAATVKRCTRYVVVGYFQHHDRLGANSFRFTGRVQGGTLKPGAYELQVIPKLDGRTGDSASGQFKIV